MPLIPHPRLFPDAVPLVGPRPVLPVLAVALALAACQSAGSGGLPARSPAIVAAPEAGIGPGSVPACPDDATVMEGWDDRAPPRRIHGNTWYVGTCGLTSLLIVSDQGHVLIDGATEPAGPHIEANIRALGFDPKDVKYLLNSHEHYDHAAGLAHLQKVSGAPVLAREPAVVALRSGRSDRGDPQQLIALPFPAVARVEAIADGDTVRVGTLVLTAHATPGHTPGGTTWTWRSCEDGQCLDIAYTDSVGAMSDKAYRYLEHPDMVAAFRRGLDVLTGLPCDVQIAPHPRVVDLFARLDGKDGKQLVDPLACRRYAEAGRANLEKRLQDEARGLKP
jgi:metallo-beta-lactamase class B